MWNTRKFEDLMLSRLKTQLDDQKGEETYAVYQTTRTRLIDNVLAEFKGADSQLSDHGPRHIENVLDNAYFLLSDSALNYLTGIEAYLLGIIILFHDVGNLYGRMNHHKKVAEIFDWARGTGPSVRREKALVLAAIKAHTGKASDGTYDTLKDVGPQDHLGSARVRLQELAAILRFADELAEGVQRTSEFMLEKGLYSGDSQIYHEYASITNVFIDRGNERVLITYEIALTPATPNDSAWKQRLATLLDFIYKRAIKLDQERRYARYYSEVLGQFKATWVKLNFHCHGQISDFLPSLKLDDKIIPGDPGKSLPEIDPAYRVSNLVDTLFTQAAEVTI